MTNRFPLHLCQPDKNKSCAACCGIYNFVDNSWTAVVARLERNTRALAAADPLSPEVIRAHSRCRRDEDNGADKRFSTIFNCEFAGFLDGSHRRVGCLLHPGRCRGRDHRSWSFYGRDLCESHYCLSYYYLTDNEQRMVIDTIDDWYLYGLVITDIDLVKGLAEAVSNRVGESLRSERVKREPLRSAIARFFHWKIDWPYQCGDSKCFGKYRFEGECYEEMRIPYGCWHRDPSPYHGILIGLGSRFDSSRELRRAEELIDQAVARIAALYERCQVAG